MNDENTKKIINACPSLFSTMLDEQDNFTQGTFFTPITFGFECGDGWANLLIEVCENIQKYLKTLPQEIANDIVALQVKEKYGTLRFYMSCYDEQIEAHIKNAEKKSSCICEQCGAPGKLRGKFWLYTACDQHTKKEDLDLTSELKTS